MSIFNVVTKQIIYIGPEPKFGVPLSSVKEALENKWLVIAIRDHWNRIPGHSYAKLCLPINSKQRAEHRLKLNKKNLRNLTGLLTGHANLNSHLFRIGRSNEKIYRLCREEDETAEHLLCKCMGLETRRYKFMLAGYFEPQELQSSTSPNCWLYQ